ncbi:unnamed protein product [Adineta ricciae]|uniref:Uncharacterized protein n=1 Tax=Adineta ricciae TaxID=249248 RepID=A0A814E9C9_ADIRI|nr:unnamed protein product [Adineta ricciae]
MESNRVCSACGESASTQIALNCLHIICHPCSTTTIQFKNRWQMRCFCQQITNVTIQPDNNSRSISEQPANAPSPPCHFRFTPSNLDLFASAGGDTQVDRYPFDQSGVAGECGGSPKICVLKLMKSVVQCPICGTSIYKNCVGAVISKKDSQQIVLDILCAVQHEGVNKSDVGSDHPTKSDRIPGDGIASDSDWKNPVICCKFYERYF